MKAKYQPLTEALTQAAARGQQRVDMSFDDLDHLVGGLPPSAAIRQWWANSNQSQQLAWRAAGFHVETVQLERQRVRFALGVHGNARPAAPAPARRHDHHAAPTPAHRAQVEEPIDIRIRTQWSYAGEVILDDAGKPQFPRLDTTPGLYRIAFAETAPRRTRIYIGETDNLHRRLAGGYRNPGPTQPTNRRINQALREHLDSGGTVDVAIATSATVSIDDVDGPLDMTRKDGRLLAENAALIAAYSDGYADILNLG